MALNRSKNYGTRWETSSEESPQGKFKDKSSETAVDGSYLQKSWINDISDGWNGAILKGYVPTQEQLDAVNPLGFNNNAGIIGTPVNEIIDTANDSQVYNAWYKHTQEVADGRIADKQIEEKIVELETITSGCWFNWYSGGNNTTDVILPSPSDYENIDFTADANTASPIYLGNNISIDSTDSTVLNFAKAGTYFFKPTLYLNRRYSPNGKMKLLISKPSDNGVFNPYFNALGIESFVVWNYADADTTNTKMSPYRSGSLFDTTDPNELSAGNWHTSKLNFALLAPALFVVIDEDNSQLQIEVKETELTNGYNLSLEFQRVGGATLSSPYMPPSDLIVAP